MFWFDKRIQELSMKLEPLQVMLYSWTIFRNLLNNKVCNLVIRLKHLKISKVLWREHPMNNWMEIYCQAMMMCLEIRNSAFQHRLKLREKMISI